MKESEKRAHLQRTGIAKIALDPFAAAYDMQTAIERITGILSETIGVERSGIWQLSADHDGLEALTIYEADKMLYSKGQILNTNLFPAYFEALRSETRIYAEDAQNDPRTAELADSYLIPLGITSLLDAGIMIEGRLIGVVCCEHIGPLRNWHPDEEAFVSTVASMVAQLFANHERRIAEKTLEESEHKFRSLTNQLPVGVYRTTIEGQIIFANPALARMLEYDSNEQLLRLNVRELYADPLEREKQLQVLEYNNQIMQSEFQLRKRSGELIWVRDNSRLLIDEKGEPVYFDGVLEDISLQKVAEKALFEAKEKAEQSDRLKSYFLANISHEIRTPMNAIIGFIDLLKNTDMKVEELKDHMNILEQGAQRLMSTLNDIVEISKIESGQMETVWSEVSVIEVMQYHYIFFLPECSRKGIELRINMQAGDIVNTIFTDRNKLDSILTNLLSNAVKFTSEGFIELGNFVKDNQLIFYVKDSGTGIPNEMQEAVFDRFIQADMERSRPHEGSGLGLSIVRAYAEMIGGAVSLESEPGMGSTFYLKVPLNQE